jgi:hypothetical protein
MEDVATRAKATVDLIKSFARQKGAKSVLIVTHCDLLEGIFNRKFSNAEVYTIEVE